MNKLPSNFTMQPGQDPHSYFRNLCIEFKKLIKESDDVNLLQNEMETLINASKDMKWNEDHKKPLKQEAGEKAISKLCNEFRRYVDNLRKSSSKANYQDLLAAFSEIERMLNNFDIK
jgi:hypothetical protein